MENILVVIGSERHAYRLLAGLSMFPDLNITTNEPCKNRELDPDINAPSKSLWEKYSNRNYANKRYDIAFVDSSFEGRTDDIKSDMFILFDCGDKPNHPILDNTEGRAYHELKDKSSAYATFSYDEDFVCADKLKRIAFPITPYLSLNHISKAETTDWNSINSVIHFYGAPTHLYSYGKLDGDSFTAVDEEDRNVFNQRYKWLSQLDDYNIPFDGGLVFQDGGHLKPEYQESLFPGVTKFLRPRHDYRQSLIKHLAQFKVGLCPAGHQRNSWRLYDLMATGSIIYRTDTKYRFLYEPKHQWVVKDDDHLGDIYLRDIKDFKEMYKASQDNREVLSKLTPEIIWKDFKNQI